MKVNDKNDNRLVGGNKLEEYTDEQLTAEMARRGFEVWRWPEWDWENDIFDWE